MQTCHILHGSGRSNEQDFNQTSFSSLLTLNTPNLLKLTIISASVIIFNKPLSVSLSVSPPLCDCGLFVVSVKLHVIFFFFLLAEWKRMSQTMKLISFLIQAESLKKQKTNPVSFRNQYQLAIQWWKTWRTQCDSISK